MHLLHSSSFFPLISSVSHSLVFHLDRSTSQDRLSLIARSTDRSHSLIALIDLARSNLSPATLRLKFLVLKMETGRQAFSVDLLEIYAAKGHGVITCMAAGNDVILLGTSKGWIIRPDFGVGDSYDIDLSTGRAGEQSIHRVFVDPGGSHCIATIVGGEGADTFYTHAKWTRPCVLRKPKGLVVNAVAWNRQQMTEASTREVILGTDNGQLHEIAVDEKDKKEKHINFLFDLKELPEAFMGLQMDS